MSRRRNPMKYPPGTIVRYTGKFLRSVGMVTGGPVNGLVIEPPPGSSQDWLSRFTYVQWSDGRDPVFVNNGNIEIDKRARRNALPGFAHLEPPSRGYGASLPSERRRAAGLALGARVSVLTKPSVPGVFSVVKVLPGDRYHVRRSDGLIMNVPGFALRSAKNPWPVELHSVTYRERKPGDARAELYEHEFEGGRKPRLKFDGRNLRIARAGSRYTVKNGWIHG